MLVENEQLLEFTRQSEIRLLCVSALELIGNCQYIAAESLLANAIAGLQKLQNVKSLER